MGLLGKMMFCKSKCMRPELMVTLEATCTMKPWTFLMASDTQEPGTSSAVKITSPLQAFRSWRLKLSEAVGRTEAGHVAPKDFHLQV